MVLKEKNALRRAIKESVRLCDAQLLRRESEIVMSRLEAMPEFISAEVVALFWSLDDEVYTHDFIEKWAKDKVILLPIVSGSEMTLGRFIDRDHMRSGDFGIAEPVCEDESAYNQIDMIVIPGIAFDRQGHRMGRGKGYYDRFLCGRTIFKVGVCFSAQLIERVPTQEHDIVMDALICPQLCE